MSTIPSIFFYYCSMTEAVPTTDLFELEHSSISVDLKKIPNEDVWFNYRKDGKYVTEMCKPDFIRKQLIENANIYSKKGRREVPKGKGLNYLHCSECGVHFLGTRCADYTCGKCNAHINVQRAYVHGGIDETMACGRHRRTQGKTIIES